MAKPAIRNAGAFVGVLGAKIKEKIVRNPCFWGTIRLYFAIHEENVYDNFASRIQVHRKDIFR